MSSAVTPVFRPPSVIAGLRETGVRMPSSSALRATRRRPAFMPTCTYTELSESVVADARLAEPR